MKILMFRNYLFTMLAIVFFINISQAQNSSVKLIASPRKDSVLLRWAPNNSSTWRLGNEYGYMVKRYTILQGKKIPKQIPQTILNAQPLKPAPVEAWEKHSDHDKYLGIAAECIYGSVYQDVSVGGSPHIAYTKYKEEKQRFSFALFAADQSVVTAKLSGLYFADKTALPDEKYLYKVYINCPDSLTVDTAFHFTGISEYQPLPKPLELEAEWDDKKVNLSWNILYLKHIYNSYIVEKSTDGEKYHRISENATVQLADEGINPHQMFRTDTLDDNKTTYYYRIKGISTFGETGPASDSIFGKGTLPLKNAPVIIANEVLNNEMIKLYWEYPEKMNAYIKGFNIYHSKRPSGKKKLIYNGRNPEAREFIDSTPGFTNYYLISVYNDKTEKLSPLRTYCERIDSFPPAPPEYFAGEVDTTGKVTLSWKQNSEEDIYGYRVYRANNPRFEFMLISNSEILDTTFVDQINLKTLTKNIYYKVKAIDERQNQSAFSEMLTLKRPDIISPVSPVIKNIADTDGEPELLWVNSSSADVVYHHIYRKAKTDTITAVVASLGKGDNVTSTYIDQTVEPGKEYTYYVIAEDDSKLQSPPSNYGYFKVKSDVEESIKLKKRVLTDQVKLTWNIKTDKEVERIVVYRKVGEGDMRLYGNTTEDSFTDNKLSPEKTYTYMVKAIYTDGSTSVMSNMLTVKM